MANLSVGDFLDERYRIEAAIAKGGMSTVYRCVDTRLGRLVAAKVMDEQYIDDPIFRQRFRREARSMAQLTHPNLVGVYDFASEGSAVFLIMELIDGGTLRELLAERGPMPPHAATAVMRAVLTGLSVAHAQGMVHRDIKPDNVLINTNNQVKVTDFGLVRAVAVSHSTSNQIVGTVSYLSPEQVTGEEISFPSDVYSCGILLFELLTGATPFSGDNQIAHAYARIDKDVPAPSSFIQGVPKLFDELVATACNRDPEERFANASEFLSALDDVANELHLPEFLVPAPKNSAAHRASDALDAPVLAPTDLVTTYIPAESPHQETSIIPAISPEPIPVAPETSVLPATQSGSPELRTQDTHQQLATQNYPPAVSNRGKTGFIVWLIAVIALTTAVAIGAWWFGSGRYGEIPQVLGLAQIQAVTQVEEAGFVSTTKNIYSNEVAKDEVVGTEPAFGQRAVKGDQVAVLVSLGRPVVPDFTGLSEAQLSQELEKRTLVMQLGEQEYSDNIPLGDITRIEPDPGTTVLVNSTVTIHTSKGPAPVKIPDISGIPRDEAIDRLESAGLKVTVSERFDAFIQGDHAITTEPAAGNTVASGTSVTLVVSTAVTIPDVTGMSQAEASAALQKLGLRVSGTEKSQEHAGSSPTEVVDTNPRAGELVDAGTDTVTLILPGKIDVPNVIGKTYSEARQILRDAGFKVSVTGTARSSARVYWQSPTSGSLEIGETVTLRLLGS
ncbi:serine/threonine-protein kinase [Corynebacterium kutscheri]|uniref:non-specific serine/threonine protein kinase n=1 Tax=Corynebacterium kutscheri TaxID=35755 RepID=A0A0F6TDW3_9CORY|nr:Stk1 family PASTA domain-containing Ser/Thr kinase [Corynebacterium kutscheri]AKE41576.1 serine/threonine protein kinase [Corynebacterium kutscheri]VEH08855.1 serine/threonine-protein kinase [Corynebacterium kutscheri]VEH09900.1 serine/threonine-protein kinase [Corynebacterium kutscheri]VEH79984.1 serine/threonine-protein kinase [Corynebacterium kutscheri]